jgi:transcriptional regulator with XRE-family HTH domain
MNTTLIPLDEIGERFRLARRNRNMSYHEVSEMTGLPATMLCRYETGRSRVKRLNTWATLSDWIGYYVTEPTKGGALQGIKSTLADDPTLDDNAGRYLLALMTAAYNGSLTMQQENT